MGLNNIVDCYIWDGKFEGEVVLGGRSIWVRRESMHSTMGVASFYNEPRAVGVLLLPEYIVALRTDGSIMSYSQTEFYLL